MVFLRVRPVRKCSHVYYIHPYEGKFWVSYWCYKICFGMRDFLEKLQITQAKINTFYFSYF